MASIVILAFVVVLVTQVLASREGRSPIGWMPFVLAAIGMIYVAVDPDRDIGELGFTWGTPGAYIVGAALVVGVLGLTAAAGLWTRRLHVARPPSWRLPVNITIQFVIQAGLALIGEELVFRGLIQQGLTDQGNSPAVAIGVSAVVFGTWHGILATSVGLDRGRRLRYALNTGLLGAIIGGVFASSGSLLTATFVHGLWNALVYPLWGFASLYPAVFEDTSGMAHPEHGVIGTLALIPGVAAACIVFG